MNTSIKRFSSYGIFVCTLVVGLAFGFGCYPSKPTPDPLQGFYVAGKFDPDSNSNKAIDEDSKNYIKTLSPKEKDIAGREFFEDDNGRHAVKISYTLNDNNWEHILIYDKNNHRIKAVKYVSGHSES